LNGIVSARDTGVTYPSGRKRSENTRVSALTVAFDFVRPAFRSKCFAFLISSSKRLNSSDTRPPTVYGGNSSSPPPHCVVRRVSVVSPATRRIPRTLAVVCADFTPFGRTRAAATMRFRPRAYRSTRIACARVYETVLTEHSRHSHTRHRHNIVVAIIIVVVHGNPRRRD